MLLSHAKRKVGICSRRAGKTYLASIYAIKEVHKPKEGNVAYIGITRNSAKRIIFDQIDRMNDRFNLGMKKNTSELSFTAANGNVIYLAGAHHEDEAEKFRGQKNNLIILDECASFKSHVQYLIEEVLEPTLIDTDGTICLIGTPSANPGPHNYFYKVTAEDSQGYEVHKWTIHNNPHIPHAEAWLKEYRERKGWDENHPIYRREWMGEWTTDSNTLVYKFNKEKNTYAHEIPKNGGWQFIMGVDLGSVDSFAIVVLAYSSNSPTLFEVDSFARSQLIPSEWAEHIKRFVELYRPVSIVADHGGLGKSICEEITRRYHIPLKPAEKTQKLANIELLNGDLISGRFKFRKDSPVTKQMQMLQWDPDRPGKEDERTPNDLCDSTLYAYREARHYHGRQPVPRPLAGSREWAQEEERKRVAAMELELKKEKEWWRNAPPQGKVRL